MSEGSTSVSGQALPGAQTSQTWKPLRYLNYYRFVLAGLFSVLYFGDWGLEFLGSHRPALFGAASLAYLAFALIASFAIRLRRPGFTVQLNTQVLADIAALILMMHASGGPVSGLGILLVVAIAGASIILAGRLAMLYAAIATLAVLGEQLYGQLVDPLRSNAYTQAGFLGLTFFATALLSYTLAKRVRESEALARQRGVDLANLEQLNDYIVRHMQSGVIAVDPQQRVRLINGAGWQLLGRPPLVDRTELRALSPPLARQLHRWRQEPTAAPEAFQPRENGPVVLARFAPLGAERPDGTVIFLEDSTEANQRLQQMKLASLGRLTASIAHEIRNPLGAISHAAQLLGESGALDQNDRRLTEIIGDHSRRMNAVIENVLQLSRRESSHPRSLALGPWLDEFADELRVVRGLAVAQVIVSLDPSDLQVHIDPTHLQQVLWNLCQNALEHGGADGAEPRVILKAGLHADAATPHLDVIDNGPGIDEDTAQQMFEPFFTTAGGGTGLGLYISRELCECNKARLAYLRAPTGGSCFRISFPGLSRGAAQSAHG